MCVVVTTSPAGVPVQDHFARVLKGLNDLHAEGNFHFCIARRGVMVKKAIMTVGPQAFMAAEKLPDKIKRRSSMLSKPPRCARGDGLRRAAAR